MGTIQFVVQSKDNVEKNMTFYVIETDQIGLLRLRSSQELGLIKLVMNTTTAHQKPKSSPE